MKLITAMFLLIWIPFLYFIVDKKISAWIIMMFNPRKTYDDNDPHFWGVGPFGSYSPVIAIFMGLIFAPIYFIANYVENIDKTFLIGLAGVTFIAILIGTLERVYYK